MRKDGGWVFISHSHLDIEVVRKIRNQLEDCGFEPLLFYLKCLSDKDEIESLIKREIDEREWFIYVDSENANNSRWVKSEREYISTLSGKKVFTIDINSDIDKQIDEITKQLKIFISYSRYDSFVYKVIKNALVDKDFLVFDGEDMPCNSNWLENIENEIENSAKNGFVLFLVGEKTNNSLYVKKEIKMAASKGAKIIPIYIDGAELDNTWDPYVKKFRGFYISSCPTDEQVDSIVSYIQNKVDVNQRFY